MPLSPVMQQYKDMKEENKDYLLFYRLGDFYEMFFDDAVLASKELDITLTKKDCGLPEKAPMCGVPYHSVDTYIARLVQRGYKVSICEQIKDPETNDVVGRKIVRTITPGTVTEPQMLDEKTNNYIVGIYDDPETKEIIFAFADISTGEVLISEKYQHSDFKMIGEFSKYAPKEAYSNVPLKSLPFLKNYFSDEQNQCVFTEGLAEDFEKENARGAVALHLGANYENYGFSDDIAINCFGALLSYLSRTQLCDLSHLKDIQFSNRSNFMELDYFTWRNLEVTETMRNKAKKGSLLWVLDKTQTAMGARKLRKFLERPLVNIQEILKRQGAVSELYSKTVERDEIQQLLSSVRDIERLSSKLVYDTLTPRDMRALSSSFAVLPRLREILSKFSSDALVQIFNTTDPLDDLYKLIDDAIVEDPPITTREGNVIKATYNNEIAELKTFLTDNKSIIAGIEAREKERTGIKTLKIGYNKVFGYYIEVSKSLKDMVPEDYIRKQTLVNGERFITAELKDIESKLLTANETIIKLENEIFVSIKNELAKNLDRIKSTAEALSDLDAFASLAEVARKNSYVCPEIIPGGNINIKDGRHPVVERMVKDEVFIPNNTLLNNSTDMISLITGPNMAGKSTYMRQVALIVLMAQIGSFVPATQAQIGIVDKIFTRVGASDDLTSGQSTFMVEMNEVAYILNNATSRSLLIFDEIGRGTSTFDGMSIAQAVIEYVAKKIKAKALFATHYHELVALEEKFGCLKNFNVAAKRRGDSITFLRKIVPGGTDDSYGIDVAKLAGLPKSVVKRAEEILKELDSEKPHYVKTVQVQNDEPQLSLAADINSQIIDKLVNLDVTVLTPIEAMNELFKLSKEAKSNNSDSN